MRKGLLLVVALLAMASFMAAMAFTSARVTSAGEIKINSTSDALLAIAHAGTDQDKIVQIEDGEAVFKFGRGKDGVMHGFQPNSKYYYQYFMHIRNNSANDIEAKIYLRGFGEVAKYITIQHNAPTGTVMVKNGATVGSVLIGPGQTRNFGLRINLPSSEVLKQDGIDIGAGITGTVIVTGERVVKID